MPTDRPRTKSAMKTWLMQRQLQAAGYSIPHRNGRGSIRARLYARYVVAFNLLAEALGITPDQATRNVEYRLAKFDRGLPRPLLHHSHFSHRKRFDGKPQAICPVCGSVLDLDNSTWTPNPEALDLEPLDDLDPQDTSDLGPLGSKPQDHPQE